MMLTVLCAVRLGKTDTDEKGNEEMWRGSMVSAWLRGSLSITQLYSFTDCSPVRDVTWLIGMEQAQQRPGR